MFRYSYEYSQTYILVWSTNLNMNIYGMNILWRETNIKEKIFTRYLNFTGVTVVCYVKMFCLCYDILSELFPWTPVKLSILYEHLLLCIRSNLHTQKLLFTILTCKQTSRIILAFNCSLFLKNFLLQCSLSFHRIKISHNQVAINIPLII